MGAWKARLVHFRVSLIDPQNARSAWRLSIAEEGRSLIEIVIIDVVLIVEILFFAFRFPVLEIVA